MDLLPNILYNGFITKRAENGEDQVSPEDTDAGIAPCIELYYDPVGSHPKGLGGGIGAGDTYGNGAPYGPNPGP